MLIPLNDLPQKLKDRYSHSKFDLSDMLLIEPGASAEVICRAEEQLGIKFPAIVAELLARFDFSRLSLANLIFEYGHNLEKLIKANLGQPLPWWSTEVRPPNLILIGTTDGHAIFLSINDGRILAAEKATPEKREQVCIAGNFEELIRLAGSLAIGNSKNERIQIASTVSAVPFWKQLASGTA